MPALNSPFDLDQFGYNPTDVPGLMPGGSGFDKKEPLGALANVVSKKEPVETELTFRDRLDPYLTGAESAFARFQKELLGPGTPTAGLPGYSEMRQARGQALEDLATGKAGMGMLFSGATAEEAADVGGSMANQLRQQYMQMLMGEAQAGRNLALGLGQLELGESGQQIQKYGIDIGAKQAAQAQKGAFWRDLLGAAGTIGGFLLGGPGGAALGGMAGSTLGGNVGGGGSLQSAPVSDPFSF